jgi:hypothetical protein
MPRKLVQYYLNLSFFHDNFEECDPFYIVLQELTKVFRRVESVVLFHQRTEQETFLFTLKVTFRKPGSLYQMQYCLYHYYFSI